jgi:hypothetical protein
MTLHFQVAYSPEFNSIESLWHVLKQRVKRDLLLANHLKLNAEKFNLLVEKCCESITYEEALCQFGANRNYLNTQLQELKRRQVLDDELEHIIAQPIHVEPGVGQIEAYDAH